MTKILLTTIFISVSILANAQLTKLSFFDCDADDLKTDKIGNIYIIKNNVISKYNSEMNFLCSYDNYAAGTISSIDVSNPFKVLVFYSEFNKIIYLDNNLSEVGSAINIDDIGFYNTNIVCASSYGGFWIFDEQNICVIHINNNLSASQQGTNLYEKLKDSKVTQMIEAGNYLLLKADNNLIIILDKFGNYLKTFNLTENDSNICVDNNIVYYKSGTSIVMQNIKTDEAQKIDILETDFFVFQIKYNILYTLYRNRLSIFLIDF